MTDANYTHIAVVLDRSGSMEAIRDATISAYNEFLDGQRREPGRATWSLTLFNEGVELREQMVDIHDAQRLDRERYVPMGITALLDATGTTITRVGERLAGMPEHERPGKVIFVVQTDGMENASREYTPQQVAELRRVQEEQFSWQFLFLGAGQDAWLNPLGIDRAQTISYTAGDPHAHSHAVATASQTVSSVRRGVSSHVHIPADQQDQR